MKCSQCGKRVPSTVRFCKHCGKRIEQSKKKKEAQTRPPLLSQLSQRKLLMAGAGVVGILILIALLQTLLPIGGKRKQVAKPEQLGQEIIIERSKVGREIASNAVYGNVIAAHMRENRRGTITVQSLHTGTIYTLSVGWRTSYHPRRYPSIGERVKVYYLYDKGLMEATQVTIDQ
ncbi:MAG: hypothetical protein A2Y65_07920 [Deltaproteobacteria bacterium RBG_13_52_11]|nr:MAG: hypothetical protein A2Y65_07920 [Deltaproteobacteria bacterium RBG_13_52_11]